jgi:predicted porin
MKNILYGTTALIAVSLVAGSAGAAEKIKLGLGGYWRAAIQVGDSDNDAASGSALATDNRNHGFGRESEIYFSGKTTLDNGIKFGVMVQLEGETSGDQMDNSYIWADGSFGRIEYGETWGPALLMSYGRVGEMIDGFGNFGSHFPIGSGTPNGQGINDYGGMAGMNSTPETKMNYFTPRMSGFQLGIGYIPENGATNSRGSGLDSKLGGTLANEVVDVGANYTGKFGSTSIAGFVNWFTSETESSAVGVAAGKDADGYGGGLQVGFGGFKIGGKFTKINDIATGNGIVAVGSPGIDRETYTIGVQYNTGPWGVGVQRVQATQEVLVGGVKSTRDDRTEYVSVGGTYNLGPGIKLFGGIQFWDFEDSANIANASPATEGEATVGVIGTKFSF